MNNGCSISDLPDRSLRAQMAVLLAVMLGAYGCVLFLVAARGDAVGIAAATLAAGVCLVSAAAALLMSHWLRDPANGLAGVLLPMVARTGLPLLLALIARTGGQGLVESGLVYYLVGFYVLAMAVEIPMSLPRTVRRRQRADKSKQEG
jgi:hypothetical protein